MPFGDNIEWLQPKNSKYPLHQLKTPTDPFRLIVARVKDQPLPVRCSKMPFPRPVVFMGVWLPSKHRRDRNERDSDRA